MGGSFVDGRDLDAFKRWLYAQLIPRRFKRTWLGLWSAYTSVPVTADDYRDVETGVKPASGG